MNKTALIEGIKQLGRVVLVAIVPLILVMLNLSLQAHTFVIDWFTLLVTALIAIFMGIDKYLHKSDTGVRGNGLTGF